MRGWDDSGGGRRRRRRRRTAEPRPDELHEQTVDGAGEGVPLQQVPDAGSSYRDRRVARPQRDAGEDLVPEPAHEAEETHEGRRPLRVVVVVVVGHRRRTEDGHTGGRQQLRSDAPLPSSPSAPRGRPHHAQSAPARSPSGEETS